MEKSKKKQLVILCVIHHRQNPSESTVGNCVTNETEEKCEVSFEDVDVIFFHNVGIYLLDVMLRSLIEDHRRFGGRNYLYI
jgi:hypothetical protein